MKMRVPVLPLLALLWACHGGNPETNNPDLSPAPPDLSTLPGPDLAAPGADLGGLSADQACTDYASAWCDKEKTCTNGSGITRVYGDLATCQARVKKDCLDRLGAPDTTSTPAVLERCGPALGAATCTDFFLGKSPAACGSGVMATRDNGATCIGGAQCKAGYCRYRTGANCGTCQAAPKTGDSCADAPCTGAEYCQVEGTAMTCQDLVATGGKCDAANRFRACAPELGCLDPTDKAPGTCQPAPGTEGAACDPTDVTTPPCDGRLGLFCDSGTKKCVTVTYAAANQACDGGKIQCAASGRCNIPAGKTMGTCQAHPADNAACDTDTTTHPPCLPPARCVVSGTGTAGTCKFADATACK